MQFSPHYKVNNNFMAGEHHVLTYHMLLFRARLKKNLLLFQSMLPPTEEGFVVRLITDGQAAVTVQLEAI